MQVVVQVVVVVHLLVVVVCRVAIEVGVVFEWSQMTGFD